MSTIFISHSSRDNEVAKELERQLSRQGHHSVFLDLDPEKGIIAGKSWEQTLYRKLRACRSVVALCSDHYLSSHWCFAEIALARMEGKAIFALKIAPLGDTANLPSILMEKQYIDLRQNPEDGYRRLWRGLSELELFADTGDWSPKDSPYLGLGAYQEKHAPVFFGRESESRACVELLDRGAPGMIMTLGASGSGKSSLVKAGVIPRLRRHPDRWLVLEPVRPGRHPFNALAESLLQSYRRYAPERSSVIEDVEQLELRLKNWSSMDSSSDPLSGELTEDERVQRLMRQLEELHLQPPNNAAGSFLNFLDWSLEDLRRICGDEEFSADRMEGSTVLTEIARDLCKLSEQPGARVLLVIDQFEELLSSEGDSATGQPEANNFLQLLRQSIEAEGSSLSVLATMRSDFLGVFQRHPELRAIDFESLSLGPVTNASMRRIIEAPARLGAIQLGDGLTDRLIADTETADALPLLSYTLWVLWRDFREDGVLDLHEYEKLGGLQGAIAREADALVVGEDDSALKNAFLELTTLSEQGEFIRRLAEWDNPALQPVHGLLDRFIDKRLLTSRSEEGVRTLEVAHEALFRSWTPLKNWLRDNRKELLFKQEISRNASSWLSASRSSDNLWRGGRLLQAGELLKNGDLHGDSNDFIKAGLRRRSIRRLVYTGIATAVFASMAVLTYRAVKSEHRTSQALEQAKQAWERAEIAESALLKNWATVYGKQVLEAQGATAGNIVVDPDRLTLSTSEEYDGQLVIAGKMVNGDGRIVATAHEGLLNDKKESVAFLDLAIRWSARRTTSNLKILYSSGHCEVVSNAGNWANRLPLEKITEQWKHSISSIQDLSNSDALHAADVLIIGNAWGELEPSEIAAVRKYVAEGGGLIMAGLNWSWRQYRAPGSGFDPCTFSPGSAGKTVSQQVYPMNALGENLGLEWQ